MKPTNPKSKKRNVIESKLRQPMMDRFLKEGFDRGYISEAEIMRRMIATVFKLLDNKTISDF